MTADEQTTPARWLLELGLDGIALTQTNALSRAVVREAARRWPDWWDTELFGEPYREAELRVLEAAHDGLRRLRLMRRRGRVLHTTARGKELLADAAPLVAAMAGDLGADDPFTTMVADVVVGRLLEHPEVEHDDLTHAALERALREGWRTDGERPREPDVSWVVTDVVCRGEAYGLIEWPLDPDARRRRGVRFSVVGHSAFGAGRSASAVMDVLIFDAQMLNAAGVSAQVAVREDQYLTALHDAIQEAFGWSDDHLYSFWLDNTFWGDDEAEYTSPVTPDEGKTADVPLAELDIPVGGKIAYVFDFGDEWRVRLTLRDREPPDGGAYPRVVSRKGEAPPQYPAIDD